MAGLPVMRIGAKGSSLSSSAVANALAHVTIDSSALDKLSSSSFTTATNLKPHRPLSFPSVQEFKASLVVLLAKLLSLFGTRTVLPLRIADTLNSNSSQDLRVETLDLTDEKALALQKLSADWWLEIHSPPTPVNESRSI